MSQLNKQHLKWASIAEARMKDAFPNTSVFTQLMAVSYASGVNQVRLELSVVSLPHSVGFQYLFNTTTPTQIGKIHLTIKDIVTQLKEELNAKVNKQTAPAVGGIPAELVQCPAVDIWQSSTAATGSEPEDSGRGSGLVAEPKFRTVTVWPA